MVFNAEVKRMLADPRAEAMSTRFAAQWLRLQDLEKVHPDAFLFPDFDLLLAQSMQRETELFFQDITVRHDRNVKLLFTSDSTFVNERLAKHYGIPNVAGTHFRKVAYADDQRRGLLGQGSVLVQTSLGNRTSPVLRGKWVMEVLLGTLPPAPPPNVPGSRADRGRQGRQAADHARAHGDHRANATCKSCHQFMDPIGLALDNFDVTGKLRYRENGALLDTRGQLYDGNQISTPGELTKALMARPVPLMRNFTENLMAYALGRRVEEYDQPTVRAVVRDAEEGLSLLRVCDGCGEQQGLPQQARRVGFSRCVAVLIRTTDLTPSRSLPMKFLTQKTLPRRTFLQGLERHDRPAVSRCDGAGRKVPGQVGRGQRPRTTRVWCASSRCTARRVRTAGASKNLWAPAGVGRDFALNRKARLSRLIRGRSR